MSIVLIVGLGNPGPRYAATRHNAGFWVVDRLVQQQGKSFRQEAKFYGQTCRIEVPSGFPQPHNADPSQFTPLVHSVEQFTQRLFHQSPLLKERSPSMREDRPKEIWLLKPTTFMNRSGQAVVTLAKYYRILPEQILVIHDDLDFPVGKVRIKQGGGDGKHNGLKDIIAHLGSHQFLRLRIGIGHPGRKEEVTEYVLNPPTRDEQSVLEEAIEAVLRVMPWLIAGKTNEAMQYLHSKAS